MGDPPPAPDAAKRDRQLTELVERIVRKCDVPPEDVDNLVDEVGGVAIRVWPSHLQALRTKCTELVVIRTGTAILVVACGTMAFAVLRRAYDRSVYWFFSSNVLRGVKQPASPLWL